LVKSKELLQRLSVKYDYKRKGEYLKNLKKFNLEMYISLTENNDLLFKFDLLRVELRRLQSVKSGSFHYTGNSRLPLKVLSDVLVVRKGTLSKFINGEYLDERTQSVSYGAIKILKSR